MPEAMYHPNALEQLACGQALTIDEAYELVRRVARDFGANMPSGRPTVQGVAALREQHERLVAQGEGHRTAWSIELDEYVAVVSAIRLAVIPSIDEPDRLKMVELLLGRAPETPERDTAGPALLIEMIGEGLLRAELTEVAARG